MNLLKLLLQAVQSIWALLSNIFQIVPSVAHGIAMKLFREFLFLSWGIMAAIPIPESLQGLTIPDPGPMGWAIIALGVPPALAIVSAAFTVKMALKLIPFVRH